MPTNEQRAQRARQVVAAFTQALASDNEPLQTNITDLLADLMHLCRQEGIAFADALRSACGRYAGELVGQAWGLPDPLRPREIAGAAWREMTAGD